MKKALAILLALLMVLAVVAGCGAKEQAEKPKDDVATEEKDEEVADEKKTLQLASRSLFAWAPSTIPFTESFSSVSF